MKEGYGRIFWGIIFILAAVGLVASQFGIFPDVNLFGIMLTIFFGWMIFEGIRKLNFWGIFMPLACLYMIYDDEIGIFEISPWTMFGVAILCSIGFSMLFQNAHRRRIYGEIGETTYAFSGDGSEQCHGEQIRCENTFGSAIRYINSGNFKNAQLENNFGTLSVYFDNAIVQGGSAFVNVENHFGTTSLYVPKEWQVQNNLDRAFGSVSEKGRYEGSSDTLLYINGSTNFGTIVIVYV